MKKRMGILLSTLVLCGSLVGCNQGGDSQGPSNCTVGFSSFDTIVQTVQVQTGKRITEAIQDPTNAPNDSYQFKGWYKESTTTNQWNFDVDIVKNDLTLFAKWIEISSTPSLIQMENKAFSSNITWSQSGVSDSTLFEVKLYPLLNTSVSEDNVTTYTYSTTGSVLQGSTSFNQNDSLVTFTPSAIPQGGIYKVGVKVDSKEEVFQSEMFFKGEGTTANPYLIFNDVDFDSITKSDAKVTIGENKKYKIANDLTISTDYTTQMNVTFQGEIDGNNKVINISGNCGAIGILGDKGVLKNIEVQGAISTSSWPYIGALLNTNNGKVSEVTSYANVTSTAGLVATLSSEQEGGAGGIVGLNNETGTIENVLYAGISGTLSATGVVKACIGGGGIVGTNKGKVIKATNHGCLGAYNSTESGKSLSSYSYMGGIAGFNYGTIEQSRTNSVGKLLAQRALSDETASEKNNVGIGGIAGYNRSQGKIETSYFEGIRVHGDQSVGGISGINEGSISSCYAQGKFFSSTSMRSYIGGRKEVGGIVGTNLDTGTVTNCYNTANVFNYSEAPYGIASKANNSVYLSTNLDNNTSYSNPFTNTLLEPTGTGNVKVDSSYLGSEDTSNASLAETYLSTLGDKFSYVQDDTIRLAWEIDQAEEAEKITVNFYDDATLITTKVFADELEAMFTLYNYQKDGYKLDGWTLTKGGEVTYTKNQQFTFAQLKEIASNDNTINFYACLTKEEIAKNALVVAYIESKLPSDIMDSVKTEFNSYLLSNEISIDDITFKGYSQTKVADYTAAILADGEADIVMGVGSNIDSSGTLIDSVITKQAYTVNNDSSRYYATLNLGGNDDNLATFVNFLGTEAASKAFNPATRTDVLRVAIYTKYVPSEIASNLETAFKAYLNEQNITIGTLEFTLLGDSSTSVANFVDLVQQSTNPFDMILGGGSNIGTTAGATSGTTLSVSNQTVTINNSSRKASVITTSDNLLNAQTLLDFLALESTAAILNPTTVE